MFLFRQNEHCWLFVEDIVTCNAHEQKIMNVFSFLAKKINVVVIMRRTVCVCTVLYASHNDTYTKKTIPLPSIINCAFFFITLS